MVDTNSVEHQISLCAPQDKVWLALTDPEQFGYWFGVTFDASTAFVEGARLSGRIAPTKADPQTARTQKTYFGAPFALTIEGVEATTRLSFRWHPFAWEVGVEGPNEPMTLVVLTLSLNGSRTNLAITESGFDRIAAGRRNVAHAASQKGWARVAYLIEKYLAGARDLRPHQ
jgi:uncharacterized protein YndB with AHSA1/START domain